MVLHEDELVVTDDLVRALIDRQLPGLADRALSRLPASGSSNVLYRLGDELLVRFPRQPGGSATIDKEARYLPLLASSMSIVVPQVVAVGEPDLGYPERWSVVQWIDGQHPAVPAPPGPGARRLARDLAEAVAELHAVAIPPAAAADSALHWYRADPLRGINDYIRRHLADCRSIPGLRLDLDACNQFWDAAMSLPDPPSDRPLTWIHTDLVAENVLLGRGHRLAAILDFGALAVGHSSVDLIVAWELLGPDERQVFRSSLDVDDADWARGRAWAFAIAVMTFPQYWHTMPTRCAHRMVMATAVLKDVAAEP